ncbi:MAG: ATP-dependent helicase [Candidatus Magasanikbacteria bacterium]|nr:ATP-dependent helicase [Candidatus Magasanikbacteria bacterium]
MAINFKKELNEEQVRVVENGDGACLVLAGAGSGKTRTITYRVAYLLEKGVPAENILLLTFTNKAAKEMADRVTQLVGQAPKGMWSGTFHHIGYRVVQQYAKLLGFTSHITIIDSEDSRNLLTQIFKAEGIDLKSKKFPPVAAIADIYSYARNAMISVEEAIDIKRPSAFGVATEIANVVRLYETRKRESGFADFDDLLCLWLKLLTDFPDVQTKLSTQFLYILVDEYQDTNRVQARIIKKLSAVHGNVLAVGDDAQSIYSFRAADIANILDFGKHYENAKIFHLLTNYRSSPEILAVANNVIGQNKNQYKKELLSILAANEKPHIIKADTAYLEAEKIADMIDGLYRKKHKLSEIAILFRSTFHSQPIEVELTRRGIPFDYRGGQRFFERAHIKDILAYLRAGTSTKDSIAWHRILMQQEGIGPESARKLYDQVKRFETVGELLHGTAELEIEKRSAGGWAMVTKTMWELSLKHDTVGSMVRAVKECAYKSYIKREFANPEDRLQDVDQLASFTDRITDLKAFLAETALQEQHRAKTQNETDRLVLSTIHQAKGLEWDTVFLINLVSGAFPNERASLEEGGIEEERRLFYVALTRARKNLFLSHTLLGGKQNEFVVSPSLFIEEIDEALIDYGHKKTSPQESTYTYEPDETQGDWRKKSFLSSIDEF